MIHDQFAFAKHSELAATAQFYPEEYNYNK